MEEIVKRGHNNFDFTVLTCREMHSIIMIIKIDIDKRDKRIRFSTCKSINVFSNQQKIKYKP